MVCVYALCSGKYLHLFSQGDIHTPHCEPVSHSGPFMCIDEYITLAKPCMLTEYSTQLIQNIPTSLREAYSLELRCYTTNTLQEPKWKMYVRFLPTMWHAYLQNHNSSGNPFDSARSYIANVHANEKNVPLISTTIRQRFTLQNHTSSALYKCNKLPICNWTVTARKFLFKCTFDANSQGYICYATGGKRCDVQLAPMYDVPLLI